MLRDGDCVFDVGANIGLFTLFVQQHCEHARVYAVEPMPEVFERLRLNATLYGGDVELLEVALGREAGQASFTYYPHVSVVSGRYADPEAEREVIKAYLLTQKDGTAASGAAVDEMLADRLHRQQVDTEFGRFRQSCGSTG